MKILKQITYKILQNGNMLDMNIDNHFYNYVLDIIDTKFINLNKLNQREHINILAPLRSNNKT